MNELELLSYIALFLLSGAALIYASLYFRTSRERRHLAALLIESRKEIASLQSQLTAERTARAADKKAFDFTVNDLLPRLAFWDVLARHDPRNRHTLHVGITLDHRVAVELLDRDHHRGRWSSLESNLEKVIASQVYVAVQVLTESARSVPDAVTEWRRDRINELKRPLNHIRRASPDELTP